MATFKRVDGDYSITTVNSTDNVNITTHTVHVYGNLDVVGNVTYIESTELKVDDPFITVAANNVGTGNSAAFPNQGLVTQTGGNTFAGLRFHNDTGEWQISASVDAAGAPISAYQPIGLATAGIPGGPVESIQYNAGSGTFGGNSGFTYDVANAQVQLTSTDLLVTAANATIDGAVVLANIGTVPAVAVANSVQLFHNAAGAGQSGVWFQDTTTSDELISRRRAVFYSLIF